MISNLQLRTCVKSPVSIIVNATTGNGPKLINLWIVLVSFDGFTLDSCGVGATGVSIPNHT